MCFRDPPFGLFLHTHVSGEDGLVYLEMDPCFWEGKFSLDGSCLTGNATKFIKSVACHRSECE